MINVLSVLSVLRLIALRGERGTFTTQVKRYIHVYRDQSRVVEILLQLENKQLSMQNTQTHAFIIYW